MSVLILANEENPGVVLVVLGERGGGGLVAIT